MSASTLRPLFQFSNPIDDYDDVGEHDERSQSRSQQGSSRAKSSGACVHCKSLKVKCEFIPGQSICQRCQAGNYECVARSRKKRKPAPTHEDLQEKAHNQDLQIQELLLQFDKLKADNKIKDWMTRAQSMDTHAHAPVVGTGRLDIQKPRWNTKGRSAEAAVASYFAVGLDSLSPPDIVKHCALYPEEIVNLFAIFFQRINTFFSILDPELHTPEKLIWTCPFLFTVICAVASRYYTERQNLYHLAMDFARDAAGRALIDGSKSIDVCQAYLLMAVYPVPKKKWTEDRSWLLMGVAIRMAIELELNQPPPAICDERESLNRTRVWLNCYCVDGSHAIQFGKMPMLRLDDYLARHSRQWYKSSSMNSPYDVHLCAYVHIIIIVAEWRSIMAGAKLKELDIVAIALATQTRLSQELSLWVKTYEEELSFLPLAICAYRGKTTRLITAYLRLVVLAVGFQHAQKTELSRESEIVLKSTKVAQEVIHIMLEHLYPTGNLRFAMEASFLYVSFAAAFLINLLRPKLLPLLDEKVQDEIIQDVNRLINVLGSKDVALDGRHTPALYARFLSTLLEKHSCGPPRSGSESPQNEPKFHPQYSIDRQATPPYAAFSWPDVMHVEDSGPSNQYNGNFPPQEETYHHSEADMDFSLTHFVRTVTQGFPVQSLGTDSPQGFDWEFQGTRSGQSMQFPEFWNL